jgi:tRNA(adenine34) deaminase
MDPCAVEAIDFRMMRRCIELSRIATTQGEFPFASLICSKEGTVLIEVTNRVARDRDITRHAELLAVSEAQKVLEPVSPSA